MFIAALCIIVKICKQPERPLTEEQIKKMWHMYIVGYFSTVRQNKTVPFAEVWMDLDNVTQSEISQKRKTNM